MKMLSSGAMALGLAVALASAAHSQERYPQRPIRWVVPNPAGGGTDATVRLMASFMHGVLGQPLVIDNKPGAATMIGADTVARSRPDGYTLLTGDNATFATNMLLYKKVPYDPVKDFRYVAQTTRLPLALVTRKDFPAKTLQELIAYAKAHPAKINFATPGQGLPHHLAMELLMQQTDTRLTHVAYKGSPAAVQDVMGGQIDIMFLDLASGMPLIKEGRVQALGIASLKRFEGLPDMPTLSEQGLDQFEVYAWQGVVVPAGTPDVIVNRLNQALQQTLENPEVRRKMLAIGVEPTWSGAQQFAQHAGAERARWSRLIAAKGLKLE